MGWEHYLDPRSSIGERNSFGPGVVVRGDVVIGDDNFFSPGTVVDAEQFAFLSGGQRCEIRIGNGNFFGPGVSIGSPSRQRFQSQHRTMSFSLSPKVDIGDGSVFHDYVTIHAPILAATHVSDSVVVGAHSHISHDCRLERGLVIAAGTFLGGYVSLGQNANIGLGVSVHPRVVVGGLAMVGAGSTVLANIEPGAIYAGSPAKNLGTNRLGISRNHPARPIPNDFSRESLVSSGREDLALYWEWYESTIERIKILGSSSEAVN